MCAAAVVAIGSSGLHWWQRWRRLVTSGR